MAIDSERKRKSAAWLLPTGAVTIVPDGSLDSGDRQEAGWGYLGISASLPPSFQAAWCRQLNNLIGGGTDHDAL